MRAYVQRETRENDNDSQRAFFSSSSTKPRDARKEQGRERLVIQINQNTSLLLINKTQSGAGGVLGNLLEPGGREKLVSLDLSLMFRQDLKLPLRLEKPFRGGGYKFSRTTALREHDGDHKRCVFARLCWLKDHKSHERVGEDSESLDGAMRWRHLCSLNRSVVESSFISFLFPFSSSTPSLF